MKKMTRVKQPTPINGSNKAHVKRLLRENTRLELLLKALAELYKHDASGPGVILAWLEKEEVFYGSISRYEQPFGQGRKIITTARAKRVEEVVEELASVWMEQ